MSKITVADQQQANQRQENACKWLRENLPYGTTVYTVVVHRTRQGARVVAVLAILDGEIRNISNIVGDAIGKEWDDRDGLWTSSDFDIITRMSHEAHGYESKNYDDNKVHKRATSRSFKAGYTYEHKRL